MARIQFVDPTLGFARSLTVPLSPGYGMTAEIAHQLLTIALEAEWALVMDPSGELFRVPRELLLRFATWEVRDEDG